MKTFAAFAVLAIAAAVAAPAGAKTATEVRVSLTGKNSVQIENEIKTAAATVCGAGDATCIDNALMVAHRQLASIMRARDTGKPAAVETVSVVRISLKGKTQTQIHAEIRTAAQTVCKAERPNVSVISYSSCVAETVRAAKAQLQARVGQAA
jgi:hypothetical protein